MKVNPGDVLFFTRGKRSARPKTPELGFKGHAFGVLLGIVPPFAPDPPMVLIRRMMGTIGYLRFDDVIDFLGAEAGAECVKKFEDRYWGTAPANAAGIPGGEPGEPGKVLTLVGVDRAAPGSDQTIATLLDSSGRVRPVGNEDMQREKVLRPFPEKPDDKEEDGSGDALVLPRALTEDEPALHSETLGTGRAGETGVDP